MKEDYYLIGEVSKITGISKDTLHFYCKSGLLTPDYKDESNGYRHYSRFNLWQLDIIATCRKLSIPLEKIKQILDLHDNEKITRILLSYRDEALRLSRYYQQVADDILWYDEEGKGICGGKISADVTLKYLEQETVIAGVLKRDVTSYHANLQEAAKDELRFSQTIQRKYGYFLDIGQIQSGRIVKQREYLKIPHCSYSHTAAENLYTLDAGEYATCLIHIVNDEADFTPLLSWLKKNKRQIKKLYAEEAGMQLFDYIGDYFCEIKAYLAPVQQ